MFQHLNRQQKWTPNHILDHNEISEIRIAKLIENGCLKPGTVVMDFNFRNSKKQRIIDEKEVKG